MPKGIPLKELGKMVTDDKAVLNFFQEHSQAAFTISMLREEGFSTNIRKVVNRLVERELLQKRSVKIEGKRWETAYHLAEMTSSFIIRKVPPEKEDESGWKLGTIECNGFAIKTEVRHDNDSFWVALTLPPEIDAKIFYWDSEDKLFSSTFSEMGPVLKDETAIALEIDFKDYFDGEYDSAYSGRRKRESKRRSRIIGEDFTQSAGSIGFNFEVDSAKRFIAIKAIDWIEEDDEGDGEEEHINIDRVGLGDWDEEQDEYEVTIEDVSHILLYF